MPFSVADHLWKLWYPLLTRLTRRSPITFLNYGYAETDPSIPGPPLALEDEPNRPCIQLYHAVAGAVPLADKRVLEVSCGHGGGAAYIVRTFNPAMMHAVDRNPRAVELCKRQHAIPNLKFEIGNALSLDFPDETFDAVVNVEASHCYPDFPQFLREVCRVLRPGGHFLYTDFRERDPAAEVVRQQLTQSGMEIIERHDISANVVRGMQFNSEKYLELIRQYVPPGLRKPAMRFAGVPGSPIYNELVSGKTIYFRYLLRKAL